jgi:hypothetical protein
MPAPIIDPVLGEITDYGDASFAGILSHSKRPIQIVIPSVESDGASIDPEALSSARRIAQDLASTVEQALAFLATFRGFGGLAKVRTIFSLQGVVTTSKAGRFWLEFQCSEDRDQEAIWRVEFENCIPTAQGRDD